jgi:hypothetical protein
MIDFEGSNKLYYRDNPNLRRAGIENWEFDEFQRDEIRKCINNPIYFIRNYVKIINLDEGLVYFDMHDYQEEMVQAFHENRFSIVRIGRQSGKTTTSVGYLLWLSLFTENYNIAITANKKSLAVEILSRYQLAYENLPMWLQQGIVIWNKGSIELENGSKMLAASTAASSVRGGSFNLVFMDEFAHVHNNLAEEFFTSTYPVISSGKTTKIIIVSTPRGMNLYYKMWMDAVSKKSDYKAVDIHWSRVPGRDENWKETTIRNTSARQFNQEFGCEFLGSTNTLIDGSKLQTLVAIDPLDTDDEIFSGITIPNEMDVFIPPVKESFDEETKKQIDKDHIYAMTVDVSEGKNLDYAAFSIFDVSTIPYTQVATYRNNQLHPMLFPDIIKMAGEYYNNAYVLIEVNNNPTVADTLFQDLEYENVLKVYAGNKKAQQISENGKATQNGVNMSPLVKRVGCTTLKTLIETDKLRINSSETIYELTRFIATNNSFAAEEGANDDLAMTLVIFAWLSTQKLFIELSSTDIRKRLQIENNYIKEDDIDVPPMPQFSNPLMDRFTLEDGDLWETVQPAAFYY